MLELTQILFQNKVFVSNSFRHLPAGVFGEKCFQIEFFDE